MDPAEERRFARRQLRELKEDVDDLQRRVLVSTPGDEMLDAVRRLIENRALDLAPLVQADD